MENSVINLISVSLAAARSLARIFYLLPRWQTQPTKLIPSATLLRTVPIGDKGDDVE